jgi:DNA-binding NtrC family response regulator
MPTTRVIFLDDDQDLREVVVELVADLGFQIEAVESVEQFEAVMVAHACAFDVAILDINLGPDAPSGIDAYRWLKSHDFPGRVVFLTGHAVSHPRVLEAARLGDARVYDKPISLQELRAIIG